MRIKRVRAIVARGPISLTFSAILLLALIRVLSLPPASSYIVLIPEHLSKTGYLWTLLTYAVMPVSIFSLVLTSTVMLFFGWHIEPVLGRVRYAILLAASAVTSGLVCAVM